MGFESRSRNKAIIHRDPQGLHKRGMGGKPGKNHLRVAARKCKEEFLSTFCVVRSPRFARILNGARLDLASNAFVQRSDTMKR